MSFSIPSTINSNTNGNSPFGLDFSRHGHSHSLGSLTTPTREPETPAQRPNTKSVEQQPAKQEIDNSVLDGPRESQSRRGLCKFFNSQKGFGFVIDNNAEELGNQEVFVHYTAIQSRSGFRSLAEGEEVEYELTTGPKGYQAVRVTGPDGRPVQGDPKARLPKQAPFMQLAPIAFQTPYGMDPYMQQHPGAMYAASPYMSHVVYVPTNMSMHHPGAANQHQFAAAQMTSGQPAGANNFAASGHGFVAAPMIGAYAPHLNVRPNGNNVQTNQNQMQQAVSAFGASNMQGTFGPVGPSGSAGGLGYQPTKGATSPFSVSSAPTSSTNASTALGSANGSNMAQRSFGQTTNFLGDMKPNANGNMRATDFGGAFSNGNSAFGDSTGHSNFFGSNLLYSSN